MKVGLKLMIAVSVGAGALAIAATPTAAAAEPSAAQPVMVATGVGGWCPWHHHWCPGPIEG
jgi:hypothetical protein